MNGKKPLTAQLLEKIQNELSEEDFKKYQKIFTGFIRGSITFSAYQEKIVELLKIELLPFHNKFTTLFRKRVIQKKPIHKYLHFLEKLRKEKESEMKEPPVVKVQRDSSVHSGMAGR